MQGNLHQSAPMPASRPIWKGHIRLSLVSIPVELFSATKTSEKIAFRQIHEPTGKPIHYEKVVAGVGPVDKDEILKGYEYQKGNYVLLTDEDLDSVRLETRKTFDLVAVRRRLRDRADLFRQALFRRAAGRACGGGLSRGARRAEEDRDDRPWPARHARQGISRGAQTLRQRHDSWRRSTTRRRSGRPIRYFEDISNTEATRICSRSPKS